MVKVLFVCTGNICRSPTAEGVFRRLVESQGLSGRIGVDSAGTHGYHVGEPPDSRSIQAARRRGVDLGSLRARQVRREDFHAFDYVIALDSGHYAQLAALAPKDGSARLRRLMDFAPHLPQRDVPDPYYGGPEGFERVLDMIEAASAGLLAHIRDTALDG